MEFARKSTKDKILHLLKRDVSLSVSKLTDYLEVTHMAVRKHLNSLEKDGMITSQEVKQPMGRPLQTYLLTEKGESLFPKNYEGITIEFLHDMKEMFSEDVVNALFKKREQRLANEYSEKMKSAKSMTQKINELVKIQNEKGYMANVSQIDPRTYELVEHNCPILAVAHQYNMACSCETELLKTVLETDDVKRTTCKTDGDDHCKFLIKF